MKMDIGDVAECLLDYVDRGETFQSEAIQRIPASNYTDPERWTREVEEIFRKQPLMLAASAELPKKGDYKCMEVLDVPLILSRDRSGIVHAMLNACRHRGGPVAEEGRGNCARFTCRYHAWSYGPDGKLLAIADKARFGEIDKAALGLTRLPCVERAGLIFVILTPGIPIDIEDYCSEILPDLDALDLSAWHFVGGRVIEGANWKVTLDGYLEGYHLSTVHPVTVDPYVHNNIAYYESFGPHMRIAFPAKDINRLRDLPRAAWVDQEDRGFNFVRHIFPNTEIFIGRGLMQIARIYPGPTPDRNRTELGYFRREEPRDDADRAEIEQTIDLLSNALVEEDYILGLHINKALKAGALDAVTLGLNERGNQFFHETIDWFLHGKQGTPPEIVPLGSTGSKAT